MKYLFAGIVAVCAAVPAQAYRIEISDRSAAHTPVFLAGYYGEQASVIDSARTDVAGKAIFARNCDLGAGIYTLVIPGKPPYDLLLDAGQQLRLEWLPDGSVRVAGDAQTEAYAEYLAWLDTRPDRNRIAEQRGRIIARHPGTFLAVWLAALQPAENAAPETAGDMGQMMKTYQYRRRHFFDNMPLSDVRLLRTPLYHETVRFYVTKFVTQHTDTLVHIAYRLLEQASGNSETFFYMSDFLIDFSLRSKTKDIHKLHVFLLRNRDMLGAKGFALLPARSKTGYFRLPDEQALRRRLENMPLTGTDAQVFDPRSIQTKYRIFYFWKSDCPQCLADVSKWQAMLNRRGAGSCFGIAVNVGGDVQQPANRILAHDPLCVNVSVAGMPPCARAFADTGHSRIVVTGADGNIVGIFGSVASLDNFMGDGTGQTH